MKKWGMRGIMLAVIFMAVWFVGVDADAATLKYDKNGGYGAISSIVIPSTEFTLTDVIPNTTAKKAFLGWSTDSTATEPEYLPGQTVTFDPSIDVTLYALWKDYEYSVTYDYNGGTCSTDVTRLTTETAYQAYFQAASYYPTITGYDFLGWSTDPSATEPEYLKGEYYQYPYEDFKVLYAVFAKKTYTITFDMNGGAGENQTRVKVHDVDLDITDIQPTRTGYTFLGWNITYSSSTAYYTTVFQNNFKDTLYAVWKKNETEVETYTVYFDANGGTGGPGVQIKKKGVTLTLSKTTPIREGASFLGWAMTKTANAPDMGDTYSLNQDITLYAVWNVHQYTITFDDNGGVYGPGMQTKLHGEAMEITSIVPTREEYTFLGWASTKDAKTAEYEAGASYTLNGDTTLYAVWIEKGAENLKPGEQFIKIKAATDIPYKKNKKVALKATTNGGGKLTYKSSNKKVATVNKKGQLTIKGYGKTVITITAAAKGDYIKTTKKFTIQVVPAKVTFSKASAIGGRKVTTKWKKVKNISGYEMYLSLDKNFGDNTYSRDYKKSATSGKITGLAKGKTYYFKIRAYKTVKGKEYYGAWSKVKSVKVK